jgi:flagellar assembly protein FliH
MMATVAKAAHGNDGPAAEPVKFLFDDEFAGGLESRAALAAAERDAFRRGQAAGETEANAKIERRLAQAIAQTAERMSELGRKFAALEARLEAEAVEVAAAIAGKLAPALIAREPLAEVEALVVDVLAHVRTAPHVVVRLAEDMIEPAGARLRALAEERGFAARLVLLPAPEIKADEVRIEWADGGIARDRQTIEARIAEAVANYLARGGAPTVPIPERQK